MAALTGILTADFSSFQAAVDQSVTKLKSFEGDAAKVESALTRVTNSLSGTKLIQDATLMVEAVERVGGVTKLTDAELRKMGATAAEATEKMVRMGIDVPPGLQEITDAAKKAEEATDDAATATTDWKSVLLGTAGALGVSFSVGAITDFIGSVIHTAGEIGTLSEKMGISAEAVQRFKYAAEESGTTLDAVESAIQAMNLSLAGGSTSTKESLEAAGLEFAKIRAMKPEEAFVVVAEAVARIEDPMKRAKAEAVLFGKAVGPELHAMALAGIKKVGDETKVMSDETILRLKLAEDAWVRFKNATVIATGEVLGNIILAKDNWKELLLAMVTGDPQLAGITVAMNALNTEMAAVNNTGTVMKGFFAYAEPALGSLKDATFQLMMEQKASASELKAWSAELGLVEPKLGSLTAFVNEHATAVEKLPEKYKFVSKVIAEELKPQLDNLEASLTGVTAASKNAPGAVGLNLGEITFGAGGLEAAMAAYTARFSASSVGAIGGGPAKDFLSWAMSMGYATKGTQIQNTFNVVDTESEIARRVSEEIARQIQRGSLVT